MASGPGIRPGLRAEDVSIVDVAPLVLYRLGLPVPDDMAGRVPTEIFELEEIELRPPRRAPAGQPEPRTVPDGDLTLEPDEEANLMQRLRALGYVE